MRKSVKYPTKKTIVLMVLITAGILFTETAPGEPLIIPEVDDVYPFVPKWQTARILHIGDSHVASGLKSSLAGHFREAGARFLQEGWVGSRSKSWIKSGKLKNLIATFRPTVVVVTLGTNEMKNHRPQRNRSWIKAIVRRCGKAKCYWVGPPPLLEDVHGYNEMLKENIPPCRYFDSRVLNVKPKEDGKFHLSKAEGTDWGDRIWRWMNGE
jgi:hypothetical protein